MAVTWDWETKCGEIKVEYNYGEDGWKKHTVDLYAGGNCWLVMLYSYKQNGEEYYNLQGFFLDKEHMDKCLGLVSGHDNIYKNNERNKFKSIKLLASKNRHADAIAKAFKKANPKMKVTVEY